MKKSLLSFILILGLLPVNAQLPSNCNVPDELRKYYDWDVANLALAWLYQIKSPDTALIDIPQWCQDTVWHGLAAIYNRHDLPEVDSVFNKYCIHSKQNVIIYRRLYIVVDTTYNWTNNWMNLQTATGIPELDSLLAKYGFTLTGFYHPHSGNNWDHYGILSTSQSINERVLCDSLESFPGIISATQEITGGSGLFDYLSFSDTNNVKYYTFALGYGLIDRYTWKFKVYQDCSIEFLGSGYDYWPCLSLPEPVNCNILYAPHFTYPSLKVEISPNPANDWVTIYLNSPEEFSFRIVDCFGRTVLSGNGKEKCQVSLTGLSPGLYLVYLFKDNSLIGNVKLVTF
jgi:hypothetical protein